MNNIYPKERNLDDIFYRVVRNGKALSLCFTDLTEQEQTEILAGYDRDASQRMCRILAKTLRAIGDQLGLTGREDDYEDE